MGKGAALAGDSLAPEIIDLLPLRRPVSRVDEPSVQEEIEMRKLTPFIAAIAAPLLAVSLVGCSSNDEAGGTQTIRFGVVPAETVEATLGNYRIFTELFEQETGLAIEILEATNVAPVVEATIAGDLDLVMLGPFAQIMARDNGAQIDTIGALVDAPTETHNSAVGLVRADSAITGLADMRGADVCFIDPGSATGYLFPSAGFLELGIDPEVDLNAIFIGDHASAVQSMLDGECAAVFTFGTNREYLDRADEFTEVWRAEVPSPGISISTELDPELRKTISEAVLKINGDFAMEQNACPADRRSDSANGEICHAVDVFWGVIPQEESYWEALREVCKITRAPACEEV